MTVADEGSLKGARSARRLSHFGFGFGARAEMGVGGRQSALPMAESAPGAVLVRVYR